MTQTRSGEQPAAARPNGKPVPACHPIEAEAVPAYFAGDDIAISRTA